MEWKSIKYDDIEYFVRYRKHINEHSMDFEVYRLILWDDGEGDPLKFESWDESNNLTGTWDINKAIRMIEGYVKWDGCSNLTIGDNGYIHSCGPELLVQLGPLFERIYGLAKEEMKDKWL